MAELCRLRRRVPNVPLRTIRVVGAQCVNRPGIQKAALEEAERGAFRIPSHDRCRNVEPDHEAVEVDAWQIHEHFDSVADG